ncbi:MAG TPA: molybdopterin cofactor-binding domain-containing protein [Gaiellaceae bacterium]|nr:molybdopterin cofactor-binding domain-containing protein [Gaiellaceae bacterium]
MKTDAILEKEFSRKVFLKGGGALIVSFGLARAGLPADALAAPPGKALPISADQVDSYLTINADNTVTLYSSIMERGQGTRTSLLMIAAEELDVAMEQISHAHLDTSTTPFTGLAGGSQGTTIGGSFVRAAAATAKQSLLGLASASLGVPAANLTVDKGVVSGGGKTVTYGELVGGKLFNVTIPQKVQRNDLGVFQRLLRPGLEPGEPPSKPVEQYKLVGKPQPRVDVPDIVTGTLIYSGDVRLPGMLHGRVVRPRGQSSLLHSHTTFGPYGTNYTLELLAGGGQKVRSVDESSIRHIAGARVVRVGNFVGVVAPNEWDAIQAAGELKVRWDEPSSPLPGNGKLEQALRAAEPGLPASTPIPGPVSPLLITEMGDVESGLAKAAKTVSATFRTAYLLHGPTGPHNAVADVAPGGTTIYHQCGPNYGLAAQGVAQAIGIPPASVREISYQGSSFYGGHSTDQDCPTAAAVLSKAVGKPVRVHFMRWDDMGYDNYDAAEVVDVRAGVDAHGKITAFDYVAYSQRDSAQPPSAINTGGVYLIPNRKVVGNVAPRMFMTAPLRSPMDRGPAFSTEQIIDELAYTTGSDPLEFRRQNMTGNAPWLAVLNAVATAANWKPGRAARKLSHANIVTGRGFGFGTHAYGGGLQGPNLDFRTLDPTTPAAVIADIEVNKKTGKIRVKHVYAAVAPGLVINPARVADQVIGTAVMGTSQALIEEVTFDKSNVTSLDWVTYPSLRFKDHPNVTPIVIQQLDALPGGCGEEPISALFPAIANAFFDATGVRIRQVPMKPAVVRDALARARKEKR